MRCLRARRVVQTSSSRALQLSCRAHCGDVGRRAHVVAPHRRQCRSERENACSAKDSARRDGEAETAPLCHQADARAAELRTDRVGQELDAGETSAQIVRDRLVPHEGTEYSAHHVGGAGEREEHECEPQRRRETERRDRKTVERCGDHDRLAVPVDARRPSARERRDRRADRRRRVEADRAPTVRRTSRRRTGTRPTGTRAPSRACRWRTCRAGPCGPTRSARPRRSAPMPGVPSSFIRPRLFSDRKMRNDSTYETASMP